MAGIFLPGSSKGASGDITGVTAGVGLSGGGDSGDLTVTLDLSELSTVTPINGDFFATLDSDGATEQKTSTTALATLFAGDGLTASSAVLAVNVDDSTIETNSDAIRIKDNGVSLAKMAGLTRGSIIYGDTNGDPAALAKGTANYVLTSDGTDIAWAAAAAGAADDITAGDGAVSIETTSGNITIDAQANDADVIIKVDDAGASVTAVTFDGSDAGNALFVNDIKLNSDSAVLSLGADDDATLTHDGTTGLTVAANPFEVDSGGNITLDAHTGIFIFQDANTEVLRITEGNSGDVTVKLVTNAKDLIFTDNGDATGLTIKDAAAGIVVPGEVMTTKVSYTDGDDAMTIADGGGVTFPVSIDITGSTGIILENDETITNSTNGTISFSGGIAVPDAGNIGSASDLDAIAISSGGVVTFSQDVTMTADKSLNLPQGANVKFTDAITQDSIDDHDAQGIIMTFTAGMTVTPFSPVYLGTDDEVHECDADAIATMPAIGVSVNTSNVTDGNPIEVMLLGLIRDETFTDFGTNGAPVFVHTTVGEMSNTAPSGDDDVVQIIGHSVGEKLLFVQPSLTYLVVDA